MRRGSHGRMKPFNARAESWVKYTERLEQILSQMESRRLRRSKPTLAVVGEETFTYHPIRSLTSSAKLSDKTFAELVELMKKHSKTVVGAWNDPRWETTPGSFYPSV